MASSVYCLRALGSRRIHLAMAAVKGSTSVTSVDLFGLSSAIINPTRVAMPLQTVSGTGSSSKKNPAPSFAVKH